jgi:hypothetical protein
MKKLLLLLGMFLISFISKSQVTIASQDFEVIPATPTLSYTMSGTGGSIQSGTTASTDRPANTNKFFDGTKGYGVANGDNSVVFGPINTTDFINVSFSLRLASYSVGSAGNGADAGDLVEVSISQDGTTYSKELSIAGNTNACWNFSGTGIATAAFDGNNSATTFVAPAGGLIAAGFGNANITSLPTSTTLYIKVRFLNNAANELWLIDQAKLSGTPAPPSLTVSPNVITNLYYITSSGGPSTSSFYSLAGSSLVIGDSVKIFAPTNFEVSKTSATSGFADSLKILYSGKILPPSIIYTRLKSGLPDAYYNGFVTHKGAGVAALSLPTVNLYGSVAPVAPPIITTSGTLNPFIAFIGVPPTSQSYTVSGVNMINDITINAPSGFLIKTGGGAYGTNLVLPQVSGNIAPTIIDVRLAGTAIASYSGNLIHTSMGVVPTVNVAVTGNVNSTTPCGVSQKIRDVRNAIPELPSLPTATGLVKTIKGQITGVFGINKIYVTDSTGGIAVFTNNIVIANNLTFGDSVQVTGTTARRNGEAELSTITCIAKLATGITPTPKIFDVSTPPLGVNLLTFLDNNEGGYVKIIGVNLLTTGSFTASTNYPISACNNQGDSEVRIDATGTTNIPTTTIPMVTQNITGLVGHYITTTQTINILQLFPNKASDFENSAITCTPVIVPASASCGPLAAATVPADSTLDVTCWNVEWLGNTTSSPSALGPTNDAQQMTNVLQVLNTVKSDIFCIEEVCDHKQFIARVKIDLPKYKVRCQTKYYSHFFDTPEKPADATTFSQKVCFVYDSTVVTMVDTISVLSNVYTYPANNWASGRLPFMFIGDVKVGNVTKQIHFVGLHAKSGSAIADYNRRKQDVIDLKLKLDTAYPNANIIMLGDYNDDLDTSIAAAQPSSYKNFVTDNVNYKQISRALSLCGVSSTAKYPDIIDHFLMSNEFGVIPETGPNPTPSTSGIYYLDKTINVTRPINYVANYTTTTSDHYPVNARFRFGLPPAPPATITSSTNGNWSSASTWDCNCVPTSASDVIINTGNTVTVDVTAKAKSLNVKGILNWVAAFTLTLGM